MFLEHLKNKVDALTSQEKVKKLPVLCERKLFAITKLRDGRWAICVANRYLKNEEILDLTDMVNAAGNGKVFKSVAEYGETTGSFYPLIFDDETGTTKSGIGHVIISPEYSRYVSPKDLKIAYTKLLESEFGRAFDIFVKLRRAEFQKFAVESFDDFEGTDIKSSIAEQVKFYKAEFDSLYPASIAAFNKTFSIAEEKESE